MSTRWWAGVAIDPETQGEDAADQLNYQVDEMLAEQAEGYFAFIDESDGSHLDRYQFGMEILTDFFDRHGNRIGFGIETCNEEDAVALLDSVQSLLARWGVDALVSVWVWDRMATPLAAPVDARA